MTVNFKTEAYRKKYYNGAPVDVARRQRAIAKATITETMVQLMPALTEQARSDGYALAVHGSGARDLDLILIPWTEQANMPSMALTGMADACKRVLGHGMLIGEFSEKPNGRTAAAISVKSFMIDVSVMPTYHANGIFCADHVINWEGEVINRANP